MINALLRQGAEVIYEKTYDLHTSGHAQQDELKLMLALTKPRFFMPVHGEYKHLKKHCDLAAAMGVPRENMVIGEIGRVVELSPEQIALGGTVPSGSVMVDGLGVGDVGSIVLRDRKHLAQDGLIIVVVAMDSATGEVVSRSGYCIPRLCLCTGGRGYDERCPSGLPAGGGPLPGAGGPGLGQHQERHQGSAGTVCLGPHQAQPDDPAHYPGSLMRFHAA